MPPKVGLNVQNIDISLIIVSDPLSPPQMEDDSLSLSRCVSVSSRPEPHQLSVENSSSDWVGDVLHDTDVRPRNLWSKGIMAFWRHRLEVYGPKCVKHPGYRKRKKINIIKIGGYGDKATQYPLKGNINGKGLLKAALTILTFTESYNAKFYIDLSLSLFSYPCFASIVARVIGIEGTHLLIFLSTRI